MKKKTHRSILEKCKSVLTDKEYGVMAKALTDYEQAKQRKKATRKITSEITRTFIQAVNEVNIESLYPFKGHRVIDGEVVPFDPESKQKFLDANKEIKKLLNQNPSTPDV